MKICSIILARGGSKGIKNKNLIPLKGQPLLSYSISASLKSNVNETWVSSDSIDILNYAKSLGCSTIERPENLATDTATSECALLHFAANCDCDVVVFIQPTSPLILSSDIDNGLKLISQYDSIFSAYKEHWHGEWDADGAPINWDVNKRPRRQDAPTVYVENGAFYITPKKNLLESKCRYSGNIGYIEMPMYRSFQVDTLEDLKFIEKII